MVEVPSAVVLCDALAEKCDFLSIGTNDLVQYTLAADRGNPSMRDLYFPGHPSVLRMIKMVCSAAKKSKTPVSVCGEIASNILFTPLLIGLGIKEISLAPRFVPHVKQAIRDWKYEDAKKLVEKALSLSDASEVLKLLHRD
jgi:phosphotransferase system enzyme I (PtsI)